MRACFACANGTNVVGCPHVSLARGICPVRPHKYEIFLCFARNFTLQANEVSVIRSGDPSRFLAE